MVARSTKQGGAEPGVYSIYVQVQSPIGYWHLFILVYQPSCKHEPTLAQM